MAVVDQLKANLYDNTSALLASHMFIVRKEGMTTFDLMNVARYFDYDRSLMAKHSSSFIDVQGGFDAEAIVQLETAFGIKTEEYALEQQAELAALVETLTSQSNAPLRISIVNVKSTLPNEFLPVIAKDLQVAIKASGVTGIVMALAGAKSTNAPTEPAFVSLQQTTSETLAATVTSPVKIVAARNPVADYLYPNILTGILIMLFVVITMIIGFMLLMNVQTQAYFPTEKIDFGKIEK